MLKRYSKQGFLKQIDLPPGLKAAPHFPHLHYFHMTEKGALLLAMYLPHLACYGNLELRQRTYLHDFIGRVEAAWRVRICAIQSYIPEIRLPDLASANQKQHDGHYVMYGGERIGVEIEAADWKSGSKLAMFVAQCFNSIANNRVQRVMVMVQTETARRHYAKPFTAGEVYHPEWVKESGKWWPRKSSKVVISQELAAKVKVDLICSEQVVAAQLAPKPTEMLASAQRHQETM